MIGIGLLSQAAGWLKLPSLGQTLWGILLAGLFLITAAMLVLSRTRWGHAKPLTKCLVLSVFAHILLIVFAYGTRMLAPAGIVDEEPGFRVRVVMEESSDEPIVESEASPVPEDALVEQLQEPAVEVSQDTPANELPLPEEVIDDTTDSVDPGTVELNESVDTTNIASPTDMTDVANTEEVAAGEVAENVNSETPETRIADELDQGAESVAVDPESELPVIVESSVPVTPTSVQRTEQRPIAEIPLPAVEDGPKRVGDGSPLPELYQQRFLERRVEVGRAFGLTDESEAAVEAALAWLARNQGADGRWDSDRHEAGREAHVYGHARNGAGADADTGITALAVLAFMAAGHTHYEGAYRGQVQRGLEFLLGSQAASGSLAGKARLYARMYCHAMAMLAASEAYALTGDDRIRPFLEKAVAFSIASQDRRGGGWRYQPGDPGDMSQFGWQVMALTSAQKAGLTVPTETVERMKIFLQSCTSGEADGLASYRPGSRPSVTMTAEALACRGWLEMHTLESSRVASEFLADELPGEGRSNVYYWYYGTLALHRTRSELWPRWNDAMQHALIPTQRQGGDLGGSWDPTTVWGPYGGRVYVTAMSALCLEVYYRYLPLDK